MPQELPRDEIRWVAHYDEKNNLRFVVTSPRDRSVYKLYTPDGDGWRLAAKSKSAGELARRFDSKS